MKSLKDFNCHGKKILLRCDFNIPLSEQGNILDDFRIKQTLPTIEYLKERGVKVILISHLNRPEGKELKYSLRVVGVRLQELLGFNVRFLSDCIGDEVKKEIDKMELGEIVLLENLRFHKQEEENDSDFAKELASLGDIYINDAFAVCHRKHASIVGIPQYLVSGQGLLLEKEIKILTDLIKNPKRPLISIIGGKKAETKARFINKISEIADFVLINEILDKEIEEKGIILNNPQKIIRPIDNIDTFDIGPKTIELFKEKIKKAKTVFWSGPLGKIEDKEYRNGSEQIAKAIIESNVFSIMGGGETIEFINQSGESSKFNHLSTGGGAMLSFLSGEELPGLQALKYGS